MDNVLLPEERVLTWHESFARPITAGALETCVFASSQCNIETDSSHRTRWQHSGKTSRKIRDAFTGAWHPS